MFKRPKILCCYGMGSHELLRDPKKETNKSQITSTPKGMGLQGAGTEGQHRATPTRAAAPEAPPNTEDGELAARIAGLGSELVGDISSSMSVAVHQLDAAVTIARAPRHT